MREPTDQINGNINLNFKIEHDVANVRKESLLLDEAIKVCQFKASGFSFFRKIILNKKIKTSFLSTVWLKDKINYLLD